MTENLTPAQKRLLTAIVKAKAEGREVLSLRDIGILQSATVTIDGVAVPRSARTFEALASKGLVGIHRADQGFGAPAAQRVYTTGRGRDIVE